MIEVGIRANTESKISFYEKDARQTMDGSNANQVVAEDKKDDKKDDKVGAASNNTFNNSSTISDPDSLKDKESEKLKEELTKESDLKTLESLRKIEEQEKIKEAVNQAAKKEREKFRDSGLKKGDREEVGNTLPEIELKSLKINSQEMPTQEMPKKWTEYVKQHNDWRTSNPPCQFK